jgi:hypothetical protein
MSQADSPHTTSPSRRTVLAGISVAAAPTVLALSIPSACADLAAADAELLRLSTRFDAIWPELEAAREAAWTAADAADDEISRRVGYDVRDGRSRTSEEGRHAWEVLKVVRNERGTDNVIRACETVLARIDAVHQQIIATPAQTLLGVGVKARTGAMLSLSHLWDEPRHDLDYEDQVTRNLIESICEAAGITLPWRTTDVA